MTEDEREELDWLLFGRIPPPFPRWLKNISPDWNWHAPHLVYLQGILEQVTAGELRRLVISMPPRHGKSEQVTVRYPVWRLCRDPRLRVIVGAYNQRLAEQFSRKARRIAAAAGISLAGDRATAGDWETPAGGGMRAVGVGAGVTGMGGDLIIIDDPVKSREEAESDVYRDRVWDWFRDDLYTRQEPSAAIVLIMTRWHLDDLAGRLIAEMAGGGEPWTVINIPATALENDPLDRAPGEALWPERFNTHELDLRKQVLGTYSYSALYMGTPVPHEGGLFKWQWFQPPVEARPAVVEARVRYYDTAGTEGQGDYTAGVLMSRTADGRFWIEDVVRGQWSPARRDAEIRATAERDGPEVDIWLERETGVAGTERSQATVRALAGFVARFEPVTGAKENRADPLAAQAEAGNVRMCAGPWNHAFLNELTSFPAGSHDDQVDAASGAFSKVATAAPWEFY